MHRFTTKATRRDDRKSFTKWLYLLLPILVVIFWYILTSVDNSTIDRQKESLENALNRDILHCYAVEGFYPPSLDYLKEHYGLRYDEELFMVDYQPIASNLRPDVTILVHDHNAGGGR